MTLTFVDKVNFEVILFLRCREVEISQSLLFISRGHRQSQRHQSLVDFSLSIRNLFENLTQVIMQARSVGKRSSTCRKSI